MTTNTESDVLYVFYGSKEDSMGLFWRSQGSDKWRLASTIVALQRDTMVVADPSCDRTIYYAYAMQGPERVLPSTGGPSVAKGGPSLILSIKKSAGPEVTIGTITVDPTVGDFTTHRDPRPPKPPLIEGPASSAPAPLDHAPINTRPLKR